MVMLLTLALSACSAPDGAGGTSAGTAGAIELAVSETCADSSDPQCVSVNGESVILPSAFERAGVAAVEVADQNAVDVTFSGDGAGVFHSLTERASGGGKTARLLVKVGDEMLAAVLVMQAQQGDHVQIRLSADKSAQHVVDLVRRG